MKNWIPPHNPPPWENKPFPLLTLSSFIIFINAVYFLILKFSLKIDFKSYITSNDGFILSSIIFLFTLFLVSIYVLFWEIKKTLYIYWCFWQADLLTKWIKSKQDKLYLIYSNIISHNLTIISDFNNESSFEKAEPSSKLIHLEREDIVGEERFFYIVKLLTNSIKDIKLSKKEKYFVIINSLFEQSDFIKDKIKSFLNGYLSNYEIIFQAKPNYNNQFNAIKNKKSITLIFSINYYALNTNEKNEFSSLIILSSSKGKEFLKLFQPMPFKIENIDENIKAISIIQQQQNKNIKQVNFIDIEKENSNNIMSILRSDNSYQLSLETYTQGYFFNENIDNYKELSIYHLLALIYLSNFKDTSQFLFYKLDKNYYCQTIGVQKSHIDNHYLNIPKPSFPLGTLLVGFFALTSVIFNNIINQTEFNSERIIITSTSFLFTIIIISVIKKIYIVFYWKIHFLKTLNKKWNL
ncbi:hypothetical protein ABN236_11265 [Proteus sp. fly-1013]|uniref:hypothetical protein n=1 Tax=Proteus sp. fly-1013 TaxID=3136673 RepID=UPI0032DBA3C0